MGRGGGEEREEERGEERERGWKGERRVDRNQRVREGRGIMHFQP